MKTSPPPLTQIEHPLRVTAWVYRLCIGIVCALVLQGGYFYSTKVKGLAHSHDHEHSHTQENQIASPNHASVQHHQHALNNDAQWLDGADRSASRHLDDDSAGSLLLFAPPDRVVCAYRVTTVERIASVRTIFYTSALLKRLDKPPINIV